MSEMSMGSNIGLSTTAVRATLNWTPTAGAPDVDVSALLLDDRGVVAGESDFVFYNQPQHPSGAVSLAGKTPGADPVDLDLTRVPTTVTRVVIAASADGGTFGQVRGLRLDLLDRATGGPLAAFAPHLDGETALVCGEFYRRDGAWKFRAVGQGYTDGLAGLATDFGIDVHGPPSPPAPSSPPPAAPSPPPPAAPAAQPTGGRPAQREPGYDPLLDLG